MSSQIESDSELFEEGNKGRFELLNRVLGKIK